MLEETTKDSGKNRKIQIEQGSFIFIIMIVILLLASPKTDHFVCSKRIRDFLCLECSLD